MRSDLLDAAIGAEVFEVLQPAELELALAALSHPVKWTQRSRQESNRFKLCFVPDMQLRSAAPMLPLRLVLSLPLVLFLFLLLPVQDPLWSVAEQRILRRRRIFPRSSLRRRYPSCAPRLA